MATRLLPLLLVGLAVISTGRKLNFRPTQPFNLKASLRCSNGPSRMVLADDDDGDDGDDDDDDGIDNAC